MALEQGSKRMISNTIPRFYLSCQIGSFREKGRNAASRSFTISDGNVLRSDKYPESLDQKERAEVKVWSHIACSKDVDEEARFCPIFVVLDEETGTVPVPFINSGVSEST